MIKINASMVTILFMVVQPNESNSQNSLATAPEQQDEMIYAEKANTTRGNLELNGIAVNVTVWGSSLSLPGISYDDGKGNSGTLQLQNPDATHVDLAVATSGKNTYAVVAYYSTGASAFIAEYYGWDRDALELIGSPVVLRNISYEQNQTIVHENYSSGFMNATDPNASGKVCPATTPDWNDPVTGQPTLHFMVPKVNYFINLNYE